jgi:hypothetical protein
VNSSKHKKEGFPKISQNTIVSSPRSSSDEGESTAKITGVSSLQTLPFINSTYDTEANIQLKSLVQNVNS